MVKKTRLILPGVLVAIVGLFSGPVATRSQSGGTLPAFGHVVIVVEENVGYSQTIGSAMPYLTSLYSNTAGLTGVYGGLATNYFADTHPSIGNYFSLSTGQILTNDDSQTPSSFPVSAANIALEVQNAGKTWKDYREMTGTYYVRHDPLAYMTNINSANLVNFTQFSTDLANGTLPNLSWIVPNGCDDAHDCSLSTADNWLKSNIGPLLSSALFQKDGLLIVVFDENSSTGNTCGLTTGTGCGGQVEAVVVSPFVTHVSGGARSSGSYEHENVLRTMAQGLGLTTFPGAAASASAMSDFFTTSSGGGGTSTLTITTTSLPSGTQGQVYPSTQLNATGGTTPYTWTVTTQGTALPAGLSLSSSSALSGTPTQSGTFAPVFMVTDSSSTKQTAIATLDIQIAASSGGGGGGGSTSCDLYVSPTGSDSNSGTSTSSAWKTAQQAFNGAQAGQTMCFMGGTYPMTVSSGYNQTLNNSGTAANPITFTNYPGQVAVLDGNTRVNGSYVKFLGTPMAPPGLVFQGPTGQALGLIDVMNTHDVTFDHVEIRNADYHAGLYQYNGYNIKLIGCYVHDNGRPGFVNTDQGIYFDATTGGGNLIANCLIEHNVSTGVQLYPGPSQVTVEENTIVNNGAMGVVVYGSQNTVVNNVLSGNGEIGGFTQLVIDGGTNHVIDSNILWDSSTSYQGYTDNTSQTVTNSIIKDPMFVAPSSNNFQLQSASPAINVANTSYQQATDLLGVLRTVPDLGSYEYTSSGGGGGGTSTASVTPSSLTFTQLTGGTSASQLSTLTNTGTANLTNIAMAISGAPFAFAGVGTCPTGSTSSVAPGGTCTISVNFTPSAAQTYSGSVTVTDSAGTQTISLSGTGTSSGGGASTLSITTTALPGATVGVAYAPFTLVATGGTTPYTWSVSAGSLPAGLSLSSVGTISGTPSSTAVTSTFTAKVADSASHTATQSYTLTVSPAITASSCTRFVSPSGSDSNSGTSSSSPWQTAQKAFNSALPGQRFCFMGGTYPGLTTRS
jgi:phosphatidylinositol-3-phosphatase